MRLLRNRLVHVAAPESERALSEGAIDDVAAYHESLEQHARSDGVGLQGRLWKQRHLTLRSIGRPSAAADLKARPPEQGSVLIAVDCQLGAQMSRYARGDCMSINYRLVATQVGDLVKWSTSLNEIGRAASAILRIKCDSFPNDSITSSRAQLVYDWILSLARTQMNSEERERRLVQFCRAIVSKDEAETLDDILRQAGVGTLTVGHERRGVFEGRQFHPEVVRHSQKLFLQGNYFHAVFESAKAYNKLVRDKSQSEKDGQPLMLEVWGCDKGVLKVTPCTSETDRNVQDGIKFLSAGLMQAIRNPTAHEPAVDWPISEHDCLDILSFISFLLRKLDDAVCFPSKSAV